MRISDWSSDVCSSDLVARRAGQRQRDAGGRSALDRCDRPQSLVETHRAAVQRIGAVVERKLVGPAIERKAAARDTIGIAADGDAEIIGLVDIAREVVIAEYDVRDGPRAVGGRSEEHTSELQSL